MIQNKELKKRIIEVSYRQRLSHISSSLTAVDAIEEIYATKGLREPFILSQGHAGLALYVVLERYFGVPAESYLKECGIHPKRSPHIDVSTGSLGHGLGIGVGMAISNPKRRVFVLISDGECDEGSTAEAIRVANENHLRNLNVYINANGFQAMREVDKARVKSMFIEEEDDFSYPKNSFETNYCETNCDYLPFLNGVAGHYHVLSDSDYKKALKILS